MKGTRMTDMNKYKNVSLNKRNIQGFRSFVEGIIARRKIKYI